MPPMPEAEPLEAPDLILMLLAAEARGQVLGSLRGITRLEKLLFLADQEEHVGQLVAAGFKFKAYDYGPYSKEVYEAVDVLEQAGLVTESRYQDEDAAADEMEEVSAGTDEREGLERRFSLTQDGRDVAGLLAREHPKAATLLGAIKEKYGTLPLRQLIRYVYTKYPSYAEASVIRDEILGG